MKAFIFSCLFFLGFALFETAMVSNIVVLPAVPDFLLIVSLYFSLNNGRLFGVSSGFVSGLILDFFTAVPFGLNCLVRTVFGYVAGIFSKSLNVSGIFFPVLLGALATLLKAFILWLVFVFYPNVDVSYRLFSSSFGFELLFNSILTPLIFKFLNIFKSGILLDPEKVQ